MSHQEVDGWWQRDLTVEPTNEELIRRCTLRPWEQRLVKIGCFASILLGLVAAGLFRWIASLAAFKPSGWLLVPAGIIAIGGACSLIRWAARRRSAPHFALLRHRLGQAPYAEYLTGIQEQLGSRRDPGFTVLFLGAGRPHGHSYWVAVDLADSGEHPGSVEIRVGPHFCWDDVTPDLLDKFDLKTCELDQQSSDEFQQLLGSEMAELRSIPSQVRDGFPCGVAIVSREKVVVAGANLAGLSEDQTGQTTVRLMNLVLRAAKLRQ